MRIILYLFLIVTIPSCKIAKVNHQVSINQIEILEAAIQEEVSGTQDEGSFFYFMLTIEPLKDSEIIIDSIVFKSVSFKNFSLVGNTPIKRKLIMAESNISLSNSKDSEATIYFKKSNQHYLQIVDNILLNEPIYLP